MSDFSFRDFVIGTSIASIVGSLFIWKTSEECSKYESKRYESFVANISATRHETNGVDYLSIPFNGQEIKLFQYNGKYQTAENIHYQEMQKASREVESNLVERTGGLK